jgi:hypothetical protein
MGYVSDYFITGLCGVATFEVKFQGVVQLTTS